MIASDKYFLFLSSILLTIFISFSSGTFCSNLTSSTDKDTPCFLEPPTHSLTFLRSSSNSLVLPCHVARSKRSSVEWWYQDFRKSINIKIYPVFPAVRPTVFRFITSTSPISKALNETDIIDVSILLRHVNVDDTGFYRCVIRPWTAVNMNEMIDAFWDENLNLPALTYHVQLTGSRLCQTSFNLLPCFSNMRTSSPTIVDAYQTAFLQCVVQNHDHSIRVFWVVGNASENNVLVTDYLSANQHNGDRLRRVFPLSAFDYSIELTINHDIRERTYSCVIDGANDVETTLFTYIIRSMDLTDNSDKTITSKNETMATTNQSEIETSSTTTTTTKKMIAHDVLTREQIDQLRENHLHEHSKLLDDKINEEDDDLLKFSRTQETSTQITKNSA